MLSINKEKNFIYIYIYDYISIFTSIQYLKIYNISSKYKGKGLYQKIILAKKNIELRKEKIFKNAT